MAETSWSAGVVGIAAIGLGLVGAAPSGATAPGANGLVAFAAYEQILTARQVGGRTVHRYLTTSGDNRRPRWSQDGARLVFYTGQGAIKTVNADGSGMRIVVASGGLQPTWQSPSRIAFVKSAGGKGDIYSVAATGGALTRLTTDGAATCGNLHPAFSYDGRYFAYMQQRPIAGSCAGEPTTVLKVVNRATGATRVVTTVPWSEDGEPSVENLPVEAGRVDFDASGRRVMFTARDSYESCTQVWPVLDVRDGRYAFSTHNYGCEHGDIELLAENAPLPDGRFAVDVYDTVMRYGGCPSSGNCSGLDVQPVRAWKGRATGTSTHMVRRSMPLAVAVPGIAPAVAGAGPMAATAPGRDGLRAFVGYDQILTYRPSEQGGDIRVLTNSGDNRRPRWSQDGARIVFYTKQGAVKTIKADGTALRTVVASGGFMPTWQSPSRIAFVKVTGGKGDVYSVAATGGAVSRLTRDGASSCGNSHPAFSFDGRYLAYIQDRRTGGTCTSPRPVLKVVDRRTGAVRVVESVNFGRYPQGVVRDRVDFLADGRHLLFDIQDLDCAQDWGVLNVTGGTIEAHTYYGCEGGGHVGEAYPLPSGPIENIGIGPTEWNQVDVQPLRD